MEIKRESSNVVDRVVLLNFYYYTCREILHYVQIEQSKPRETEGKRKKRQISLKSKSETDESVALTTLRQNKAILAVVWNGRRSQKLTPHCLVFRLYDHRSASIIQFVTQIPFQLCELVKMDWREKNFFPLIPLHSNFDEFVSD